MKKKNTSQKRYPYFEKKLCSRLFTLNAEFSDRETVGQAVEDILISNGLEMVGYSGARGMLVRASFKDVPERLRLDKEVLAHFLAGDGGLLEIGLLWYPPVVFEMLESPRLRLDVSFAFSKDWSFQTAEDIFRTAIKRLSPYWGELNLLSTTQFPTLCTLDGHHHCVPHLGSMNYFGPEYCEFFGGIERIKSAGFESTTAIHEGALVSLGVSLDNDTYKTKRAAVEPKLADGKMFDPDPANKMPVFGKGNEKE